MEAVTCGWLSLVVVISLAAQWASARGGSRRRFAGDCLASRQRGPRGLVQRRVRLRQLGGAFGEDRSLAARRPPGGRELCRRAAAWAWAGAVALLSIGWRSFFQIQDQRQNSAYHKHNRDQQHRRLPGSQLLNGWPSSVQHNLSAQVRLWVSREGLLGIKLARGRVASSLLLRGSSSRRRGDAAAGPKTEARPDGKGGYPGVFGANDVVVRQVVPLGRSTPTPPSHYAEKVPQSVR